MTLLLANGAPTRLCDGVWAGVHRCPADSLTVARRRGLVSFAGSHDAGLVGEDHYVHAVAHPELGQNARDRLGNLRLAPA
jgi:hypothetical protein